VFADLRTNVYNFGKSGLLGMALDPSFPTKPYVYVLYTYDAAIGGTAPQWGTPGVSADPCPPANNGACLASGRLTRLQANGSVMTGSEQVLVADWYQQYASQPIGGLAFGPDGSLYASAGDGASSTFVDFGQTDNPSPDPPNEGGALRSQDLRTPADPVTLSGSIIRINPDTGQPLPETTSMIVGAPTIDAHGVKSFPVTSVFQGPQPTIVRVLEPTNPAPGIPRRFLYVLPVEIGVTGLSSLYSDGLEELRLLDVPNRYNVTLIAPSFQIMPWYGDHDSNPDRRMESFIIRDLVPFGDSFGTPGVIPQRWALGFSKSGNGALFMILRHPNIFSAAAAWDAPAQFTDMSAFPDMQQNFGTEANFDRYEIPTLVVTSAEAFRVQNRLWISGDQGAWTAHMIQLNDQMVQAAVLHNWVQGGPRAHSWNSGWLEGAVASLGANATSNAPIDANEQRIIAYGLRSPSRFAFRPGTSEIWVADSGWNDWEEIERIPIASDGVIENFGWPCYEGNGTNGYAGAGLSICNNLYAQPTLATAPFYAYHHSQPVVIGDQIGIGSGTISGLAFYTAGSYPTAYDGALFFSDYLRNSIWAMLKGADGSPDSTKRITAVPGAASPVDLKIGPGGYLFYVDFAGGDVRRISSLAVPPDVTPPVRLNGAPTGALPAGTTQTTISLTTNENATCRYATTAGVAYGSMSQTFTTTGAAAHSTTVTGLTNGGSYNFFVRCQDPSGNANTDDFTITFSVGNSGGLKAAWGFNEASGTTAVDSSGNAQNGTIVGASRTASGKYGKALSFNGTSNYVNVPDSNLLDLTTGMTISAWVNPSALVAGAWRNVIIKERAGGEVYNLYANSDTNAPIVYVVRNAAPGTPLEAHGTAQIPLNTWTYLAATFDGTTLRLYVNGVQVGTRAVSGALLTSTGVLRIGGNSIWGEYFKGLIDEARVYNRALSQAELQTDMNTPIN
jgi:glucose/arabinose dehydrogenase